MKKSTIIILSILGIVLIWMWTSYNGLVSSETDIEKKWGNVESVYQRRLDVYTNVISVIKGSGKFEKSTLENIVKLRSGIPQNLDPNDPKQMQEAQRSMAEFQKAINITVEAYPNIKTTDQFKDFQVTIEGSENRVNTEIIRWNEAISDYNLKIKRFPGNIMAGLFGFEKKANFKAEEGAKSKKISEEEMTIN